MWVRNILFRPMSHFADSLRPLKGKPTKSLRKILICVEPNHKNAKKNIAFFELAIKNKIVPVTKKKAKAPYMEIYSSLCRGNHNKVSLQFFIFSMKGKVISL